MSKHQFTDIRVAIEPDNPAVQRLEFKCIKCGSCKAQSAPIISVSAVPTISRRPEMCLSV